ncbi:MAG: CinA family protein [Treponema sp.]|nr:CinA family protein [Treponema sp.]MCL2251824.1 CinA family protein [Treponema sp.]
MSECNELKNLTHTELINRAEKIAENLTEKLKKNSLKLALAESCTAGIISGLLANISGASNVLWGSYVCYMQEAKVKMLDLDNNALCANGLVSRETACSMAQGALQKSGADIAASVTGLAGMESDGKVPGGTIWIAVAVCGKYFEKEEIKAKEFHFTGDRNTIRMQAAIAVLEALLDKLS